MDERTDPATDLQQAYRNCTPRPLRPDHPWYVDLSEARGGDLKRRIVRTFELKERGEAGRTDTWKQLLFLGLRGSGKTTEINRLCADLRHRFEVVYLEANTELNPGEFDLSELVLGMAVGVERHFREHVNRPLPDEPLRALRDWYTEVTRERVDERVREVKATASLSAAGAPESAKYFASVLGMLRRTSTERTKVVEAIRRYPAELVKLANDVFGAAHKMLGDSRELVIVVDNLDRYGPETVDQCLASGVHHLQSLEANLLLTPPVDLLLRPHTEPLNNLYATEFMFTPALRREADPVDTLRDPGRRLLRQTLECRINLPVCFQDSEAVVDLLLRLTGGSLRDLMELIREAIIHSQGEKLTTADVQAALGKRLGILSDQVELSGYTPLLARIEQRKKLVEDERSLDLLYRRWVLKYNHSDWYALHPYVRHLPQVQRLLSRVGHPDPEERQA